MTDSTPSAPGSPGTPGSPAGPSKLLESETTERSRRTSGNAGNSVLVIGCGYVGAQLLRELNRAGCKATGITLSEPSADALRREGLDVVAADLRTSDLRVLTVDNPSTIIHCASSGKGGLAAYREIFLKTIRRLIEETSFEHLIFTSSTSVYTQTDGSMVTETAPAKPERETGKILRETEELVLAHDGAVLRLAGIYGPGRCVPLEKLLSGEAVIEGDGERIINSIHRDDAVSALYLATRQRWQGIFNVADTTPMTQLEWFQWVCPQVGRPLPRFAPRDLDRKRAWTSKRVSSAKLRSLGWTPRYPSFREGVAELISERERG
ncbi:MAG: NAD-dependent epimerase/dehydratase family protein [Verrucomicrobia bacterium]|nr:NAD-dependent epimerase/dehydratase family protein [Verrucomicrobiota bacterium]MBV8274139.1 NAD-dependent epimerase/dehydratase family protein [Verrucomicrobiota bacterium]